MTHADFTQSVETDSAPPAALSNPEKALWLVKNDQWDASHAVVDDIPGEIGSWIHAHLHLIEGDLGNAGYWYRRANRPARSRKEIDAEWEELARFVTEG